MLSEYPGKNFFPFQGGIGKFLNLIKTRFVVKLAPLVLLLSVLSLASGRLGSAGYWHTMMEESGRHSYDQTKNTLTFGMGPAWLSRTLSDFQLIPPTKLQICKVFHYGPSTLEIRWVFSPSFIIHLLSCIFQAVESSKIFVFRLILYQEHCWLPLLCACFLPMSFSCFWFCFFDVCWLAIEGYGVEKKVE